MYQITSAGQTGTGVPRTSRHSDVIDWQNQPRDLTGIGLQYEVVMFVQLQIYCSG